MSSPDRAESDLTASALSGVRWVGAARLGAEALTIGAAVVLARLISPAQFGLLATALIMRELALMTANEGIGSPIVQRTDVTDDDLRAAGFLAFSGGLALSLLTAFVIAPFVAEPLFGAGAADLYVLFAPSFLLAAGLIVPLAMLQRGLAFKAIGLVEVVAVFLTAGTAIVLAIAGLEAEAYVIGMLLGMAALAVGYTLIARPPMPAWRPHEMRSIARFGLPAVGAGLSSVGYRNIDYLIVGARLGPLSSGYYYRAFTLGVEYERKISGIVARVAFPVYSRTRDLEHLREVRERVVRANVVIVWPFLAVFMILAPELVPWLFGERWEPAVVPAQILAIAGMAQTVRTGTGPVLLAAGKPRLLMGLGFAELAGYAAVVLAASGSGITRVAIAVSAFQVLALILAYRFVLGPAIGVPLRRLAGDVVPAAAGCLVAGGVGLLASDLLIDAPAFVEIAVVTLAAGASYLAVLRLAFHAAWGDLEILAVGMLPRRRRAAAAATPST